MRTRPTTGTAAAVVLGVKAVLGFWAAFALLAASRLHHRSFLGSVIRHRSVALGITLGVLAVVSIVIAVALIDVLPWARLGAFVLEAVGMVLALSRIASRPGSSVVSLVLSLVIIGLLLLPSAAAAFRDKASHLPHT